LRYLPRRLSLSLLQLLGVACGVAAVVGMTLSAKTALTSFSNAVEFLRGKATHSLQQPVGPMEEALLAKLSRDPSVDWFSPVIDRRLRLGRVTLSASLVSIRSSIERSDQRFRVFAFLKGMKPIRSVPSLFSSTKRLY